MRAICECKSLDQLEHFKCFTENSRGVQSTSARKKVAARDADAHIQEKVKSEEKRKKTDNEQRENEGEKTVPTSRGFAENNKRQTVHWIHDTECVALSPARACFVGVFVVGVCLRVSAVPLCACASFPYIVRWSRIPKPACASSSIPISTAVYFHIHELSTEESG